MELREHERIDDLGRRGYRIIQNEKKFCFGVDAALLAWFSSVKPEEQVIDLGTGTGIIPLLMDARNACGRYTALEIQEEMAEMASRSVLLNEASDHIQVVQGDIKEASSLFGKSCFDVVTTNPPYMKDTHGLKNPDPAKAISRHEVLCTLEDVIREAAALLKPGGRFYMVHRPQRLTEIITCMQAYKLAPSRMRMVHSYVDSEASMVLISGTRCGHDQLKVEAPVILYSAPGVYTRQVIQIYEDAHERPSEA